MVEAELVEDEPQIPENTDRRVITRPSQAPAVKSNLPPKIGSISGDTDPSDYDMPQLKIAQGSDSKLINDFGFADGDLVLNNEVVLYQEGCEPVELTVLLLEKKFQEQKEYGGDDFPRIFNTAAEAQAEGLVPFGGDDQGYVPIYDLMVLIKQPEGVEGAIFTEEFEGTNYALALYRVGGTAVKAVARKIFNQSRTRLRNGTHTASFKLSLAKAKWRVGSGWAPVLKDGEVNSPEFIEFCERVGTGG